MRHVFLLLVLLAFFQLVAGQSAVEPKLVGASVISLQLNWDIDFNGQTPQSASFTSFSFLNTSTQEVSFTTTQPFTTTQDEFGNKLLLFELNPSQAQQRITLDTFISINPEQGLEPISGELTAFLQPSEYVVITPQISAKAREIIGNEQNPLAKAALLTSWVHNNVVYDLSYQDRILNSQEVFEVRRGVCNEYSHLLLAMLRSVDVPARFAAGFVYSGEIWAAHAWVEVGVNGKWYPFDPTYNEGIVLDGTHAKFASGIDQGNVVEQFSARGNVDLSSVSLLRSHNASLISYSSFSKQPDLELFVTNDTVQASSIQNITVSIQSNYPEVITYPVSLDVPEEVKILTEKTKLLMFFPGEKKFVTWSVLIPSNLREAYLYTYPLIVRSLGAKAQASIQAQKGTSQTLLALQLTEIRLRDSTLIVSIKNTGNTPFETAVAEVALPNITVQKSFSLGAGEEKQLEFHLSQINASQRIEGNLSIEAANYSSMQPFALEPALRSDPALPAFNIRTGKSTSQVEQDLLEKYGNYLPYGVAAIVLILFAAIIIFTMQLRR